MGRSSKDVRQSRSIQLFIFEFTCLGLESDIFKDNPRSLGARVLTIKKAMSQHHGEILFRRLQTQVINMLFFQNKWIVENGLAMVWVAEAALKWNIEVQVFYFVFGRRPQPCQRVNDYIPLTIPLEPICFAPRKRSRGLWFQFFLSCSNRGRSGCLPRHWRPGSPGSLVHGDN